MTDPGLKNRLAEISNEYAIPISDTDNSYDFLLVYFPIDAEPGYACRLHRTGQSEAHDLLIDYCSGSIAHRSRYGGGRKQPLARAVGMKPGFNPRILDVTGGLGRDAFILASLGCEIMVLERNPIIFELLHNAWQRALAQHGE